MRSVLSPYLMRVEGSLIMMIKLFLLVEHCRVKGLLHLGSLSRAKYEEADVVDILESSPDRIKPKCDVYGVCGGCSFQHLSSKNQINAKQSWLKSAFMGQAKIEPKKWLQPLQVESWGYRRKARLGVRYVEKKEKSPCWIS